MRFVPLHLGRVAIQEVSFPGSYTVRTFATSGFDSRNLNNLTLWHILRTENDVVERHKVIRHLRWVSQCL